MNKQATNKETGRKKREGGGKKGDNQSKGNLPVHIQKVKKEAKQKWLEETNTN